MSAKYGRAPNGCFRATGLAARRTMVLEERLLGDRAGELKTRCTKPPARRRGYGDSTRPDGARWRNARLRLVAVGPRAQRRQHRGRVFGGAAIARRRCCLRYARGPTAT